MSAGDHSVTLWSFISSGCYIPRTEAWQYSRHAGRYGSQSETRSFEMQFRRATVVVNCSEDGTACYVAIGLDSLKCFSWKSIFFQSSWLRRWSFRLLFRRNPVRILKETAALAVPQLRRLVPDFPMMRLWFDSMSDHVGFVVDKVILGRNFA
jgi:hypothetical protein